jgi:hypothetical protein
MRSGLTGDWHRIGILLNPDRLRAEMSRTTRRAGIKAASEVKKGIVSGSPGGRTFAPLSDFTKNRKGSSKPLIDNGDLVGSITHEEVGVYTVWVGVKKGSRSSSGRDVADIAWVHEYGCTIRVTEKMRAYLHTQGMHLKASTQYINIPERSFLRSTLNDPAFRETIGVLYLNSLRGLFPQ